MSGDTAAKLSPHGMTAPGVIEMAVSQEEIFEPRG